MICTFTDSEKKMKLFNLPFKFDRQITWINHLFQTHSYSRAIQCFPEEKTSFMFMKLWRIRAGTTGSEVSWGWSQRRFRVDRESPKPKDRQTCQKLLEREDSYLGFKSDDQLWWATFCRRIVFSNNNWNRWCKFKITETHMYVCVCMCACSVVSYSFVTPWSVAHQACCPRDSLG